jgi:hypothetical protein
MVSVVLDNLGVGLPTEEILASYPSLKRLEPIRKPQSDTRSTVAMVKTAPYRGGVDSIRTRTGGSLVCIAE